MQPLQTVLKVTLLRATMDWTQHELFLTGYTKENDKNAKNKITSPVASHHPPPPLSLTKKKMYWGVRNSKFGMPLYIYNRLIHVKKNMNQTRLHMTIDVLSIVVLLNWVSRGEREKKETVHSPQMAMTFTHNNLDESNNWNPIKVRKNTNQSPHKQQFK